MRPVSVWQWSPWGLLLCLLCSSCLGSPSPSTPPEKRAGSQGLRFRLAGFPRKPFEGRVEIQRAGEWGTICDDDFTLQAAHVLCRELGFTEATGWTHSAKYGPGTGRIWLDNLSCSGTEQSVTECASRGWGNSDCTHDEDAGVICKDQRLPGFSDSNVIEVEQQLQVEEVRLRPAVGRGRRPLPVTEGLVEVKLPDGWSQVCDKGWSAHNSHVVCGMLGFPSEKRVNTAFYRQTLGAPGCAPSLARPRPAAGGPASGYGYGAGRGPGTRRRSSGSARPPPAEAVPGCVQSGAGRACPRQRANPRGSEGAGERSGPAPGTSRQVFQNILRRRRPALSTCPGVRPSFQSNGSHW